MSYTVEIDGEEVTLPVSLRGGVLHIMIRAASARAFRDLALQVGVLVDDPERGVIPAPSVTVHRIGHPVRVPAQADAEGNVLTPAVLDGDFHANVWIDVTRARQVMTWLKDLSARSARSLKQRKNEMAYSYRGVEVIDPDTVATPANVLL